MQTLKLKSAELPTRLEWLRELKKRGALDRKMQEELQRLEAGAVGEQFVLDALAEFGAPHWKIFTNVWLKSQGVFECDLVVLTNLGFITIEIKNYSGHFEFHKMQCKLNGEKIGFNAISQAQRSYIQLEQLMRSEMPGTKVYGALVFVGDHNTVVVHDEVNDIQIVMRNELRNFIWDFRRQERNLQGPGMDIEESIGVLERYGTEDPFSPDPIPAEMNARIRKGICCSHCGSFDVDASKSYVVCSCGMHEPRENAIVRTICEYGVIHFDKELVTSEVLDFFGGQISRATLLVYLKKHFKRLGTHRNTIFENISVPFAEIHHLFNLIKVRFLHITEY